MSNANENTQTMESTPTPLAIADGRSSPQEKRPSHGSKHSGPKGGRKTRRSPPTVTYKLVPMDRDPEGKGAPPIVKGKQGSNLQRIEEATGTRMRFLNRQQQRDFTAIEVNTNDARILRIEIDRDVTKEDMSNRQRLNRACQLVAKAIQYWRDVEYPPPEVSEEEDEQHEEHSGGHHRSKRGHRHQRHEHQGHPRHKRHEHHEHHEHQDPTLTLEIASWGHPDGGGGDGSDGGNGDGSGQEC